MESEIPTAAQERCDTLFAALADGYKSVDKLVDGFFGFLARRTDFFTGSSNPRTLVTQRFDHWKDWAETNSKPAPPVFQPPPSQGTKLLPTSHAQVEEIIEVPKTDVDNDDTPLPGNGGRTDLYYWTQTLQNVEVNFPLSTPVQSAKQCRVEITSTHVHIKIAGQTILEKELSDRIKPQESFWTLEDSKLVHLTLEKSDAMKWWSCVFKGDPEIDTKKITPENSKLADLDPDLRQTVEKMMFDQEQKAKGLPTSDQLKQAELLEQFKRQHPEMDFSKAQINWGNSNAFNSFPG